jgi:hypothetical protein
MFDALLNRVFDAVFVPVLVPNVPAGGCPEEAATEKGDYT